MRLASAAAVLAVRPAEARAPGGREAALTAWLDAGLGPPGAPGAALHAFHLPDAGAVEVEARRLLAALSLARR